MKPYDGATRAIASGGVTSSLIIPGSANIMGGEGTVVKNRLRAGPDAEPVVAELLLEHGIEPDKRHRYMKMACGENPKFVYGHTRMGLAWELRRHLRLARDLLERQDAWCAGAEEALHLSPAEQARFLAREGARVPDDMALESTVGMLRGRVAMHNHCYEPEDFETMLRISREFGFRVRAFHHAIAAWQVPEMLKSKGENVTVATFAEFSLYKVEAYQPSLYAGKILNDHGVPVAYKSDHVQDSTNAKYLVSQAAIAHAFHLPADKALQAVTSVPARAIDLDDRIGYVRPGYDADIVVWDSHPLSIGAAPRQVYIDGVSVIHPFKTKAEGDDAGQSPLSDGDGALSELVLATASLPQEPPIRPRMVGKAKRDVCGRAERAHRQQFIISGIQESFLKESHDKVSSHTEKGNLTLVIDGGEVACLDSEAACAGAAAALGDGAVRMTLANGHLTAGFTAVTAALGMQEIAAEPGTGDGAQSPLNDFTDPDNVSFAKYGVTLKGKAFARARLGGVTRAITPPVHLGGPVQGVSVGFRTGGKKNLLDGGIFRADVALHVSLGNEDRINPGAISLAVQRIRSILKKSKGNDTAFGQVADGKLPLVVHAESEHDTQQVILLKKDFPDVRMVLMGGHSTHLFAKELAKAEIPVILTAHRAAQDTWQAKDALPGPPLSPSLASILSEAGVLFAIALPGEPPQGESRIHDLAFEAAWAAKYIGLSRLEALRLVSENVEEILGLEQSGDVVVWEGDPLQFGSPALIFHDSAGDGRLELTSCWPDEVEEEGQGSD